MMNKVVGLGFLLGLNLAIVTPAVAAPVSITNDQAAVAMQPPSTDQAPAADQQQDKAESEASLEQKQHYEQVSYQNPYAITAHHPNYMLPFSYNKSPNQEPYQNVNGDLQNTEMKFQLSFKVPVWRNIFDDNGHLFFAYTQQSYWQAYNSDLSSPFRETNYEPEVFMSFDLNESWLDNKARNVRFGFSHQSNGRSVGLSRSWNRLFAEFMWQNGEYTYVVKPWYRIPEEQKDDPNDPEGDDNPNIYKYMGYAEASVIRLFGDHSLAVKMRHNLNSESRGAIEIGYSFPLSSRLKGYVQLFNGYGESLIDYDDSTTRIGVGIMLTDWL